MLNQLDNLTERVRGSNKLVDRWLHVRKHLLVAYYNLVGIKPGKESYMRLNEKALDDFCQSLVDYLSAGHFSIYERILHKLEGNGQLARAAKIWPQLEANTQQIMDYYDSSLETAIDHNDKSIGSGGAVYLDVNYKFVPWFNLTVRNRYNHNNYSSTDLSGELDNNDTYEIGTYWNFKITDKFSYTFEPHYFMRVNDFNSSNGKDHHWEITNTFRYRINEHWLPYFELRWLDRNVEPYHREQNQIRIGTKYFF